LYRSEELLLEACFHVLWTVSDKLQVGIAASSSRDRSCIKKYGTWS
jgi:hypothetical protein